MVNLTILNRFIVRCGQTLSVIQQLAIRWSLRWFKIFLHHFESHSTPDADKEGNDFRLRIKTEVTVDFMLDHILSNSGIDVTNNQRTGKYLPHSRRGSIKMDAALIGCMGPVR